MLNPLRNHVDILGFYACIHDLRHTVASLLVSGGVSLEKTGRLLGHTQIGTTQRLAYLIDSPLRTGVNAGGEKLKPRLCQVGDKRRFGREAVIRCIRDEWPLWGLGRESNQVSLSVMADIHRPR